MDNVEERPYTPRNGSMEDVSRNLHGTKTDNPPEEKLPQFDADVIDGGMATPRYSGVTPNALEAQEDLAQFSKVHRFDPNLNQQLYQRTKSLAAGMGDVREKLGVDQELAENSPYPEVRAAVPNTDDPSVPCNTIRMWTIAFLFTTLGSGINMLLSLRRPSIVITAIVAQLLSFPIGQAWGRWMPAWKWTVRGHTIHLNPGPFNIKEHTLIVLASNVSYGGGAAYATDILLSQYVFYGQNFGGAFASLLVISTQCIGYSLAGVMRRFLVWPAAMIWPTTLVNATLFHTLFRDEDGVLVTGWRISRYKYFLIVFVGMFVWNWIPGYIFTGVSNFAFVTWIKPDNVVVNQVFGSITGLDYIPLTVDWSQITGYLLSPLMTPFWAIANVFVGFVFWIWFISPILHFTNVWYGKYMPISTPVSYDNTGAEYNVTNVLDSAFHFDLAKYKSYSPLFLGTTFALAYGLSFASITCVLVHTYLFYGAEIWRQFKEAMNQEDDIHMKLNKAYKQAPDWWYAGLGLVMFGVAIGVCEGWDTQMPWWAMILAMVMATIFFIPCGVIQAISNIQIGLNVITEFVAAYALAGKPIANMTFKVYGYMAMYQGLSFAQDLKLGHYMHLPPKMMFSVQVLATIWGSLVNVGVLYWSFANITGICTSAAVQNFTCPQATTFFTASVVWGAVGPQRLFERGQLYYSNLFFFLIGAVAPIPIYFLARRYPGGPWKFFNTPIFFAGTAYIPPATAINYATWSIVGFVFNFVIKRRHPAWWSKYNYVTSAGLDCGLAISLIVIFLCLSLPKGGIPFNWWGNVAVFDTADANGVPLLVPNTTFGPATW